MPGLDNLRVLDPDSAPGGVSALANANPFSTMPNQPGAQSPVTGGEYSAGDRFEDDDFPDTQPFFFNDNNIFENFNGIDFNRLLQKTSNGLKVVLSGDHPIAKQIALGQLQRANPVNANNEKAILGLFKHYHDNRRTTITNPVPGTESNHFENFAGLHQRVWQNRRSHSNFSGDGDIDFCGFDSNELEQYSDFLGIDFGKIVKGVGNAVGSAAKAVGNAVGSAAKGVVQATVWTGKTVGKGAVATGKGLANAGKFAVRNTGNILEAGAGAALVAVGVPAGAALAAAGLNGLITDANGGVSPFTNDGTTAGIPISGGTGIIGATDPVYGGQGGMISGSPNPFGNDEGQGDEETEDPSDLEQPVIMNAPQTEKPFYKKPIVWAIAAAICIAGYFIYKHYHKK